MSGYPMGRALAWVLAWAVSGPGPQPRPLGPIEHGGFHFTKYTEVVGLNRLLSLAVCVAHVLAWCGTPVPQP